MNEVIKILGVLQNNKTINRAPLVRKKIEHMEQILNCIFAPTKEKQLECFVEMLKKDVDDLKNHCYVERQADTLGPKLDKLLDYIEHLYDDE